MPTSSFSPGPPMLARWSRKVNGDAAGTARRRIHRLHNFRKTSQNWLFERKSMNDRKPGKNWSRKISHQWIWICINKIIKKKTRKIHKIHQNKKLMNKSTQFYENDNKRTKEQKKSFKTIRISKTPTKKQKHENRRQGNPRTEITPGYKGKTKPSVNNKQRIRSILNIIKS